MQFITVKGLLTVDVDPRYLWQLSPHGKLAHLLGHPVAEDEDPTNAEHNRLWCKRIANDYE